MKIRTDFVTNSSSSSFILAFSSEEKVPYELLDGFPADYKESFGRIWQDIEDAPRLTAEEVEEFIISDRQWYTRHLLRWDCVDERGMTHEEAKEYVDSPQGQEEVRELLKKLTDSAAEKMKDKNVIVMVEYGDHEHPDLEHEVMPSLNAVVTQFSHH